MKRKIKRIALTVCVIFLSLFFGCSSNPFTGKNTMALISDSQIMSLSQTQYKEFLNENKVITGTEDAAMVTRVGNNIRRAAEKWLASQGQSSYLKNYDWEYKLVDDKQVNAWCMPGGKIVVYTGILPVTKTEAGLAVVMGHEVAHALLNHGQQRMSAGILQQLGASALSLFTDSQLLMAAYNIGTTVGATLPFSRKNESESDRYGLMLMAIAGYKPNEAVSFWKRMAEMSGGGSSMQFLSTHPSHDTRVKDLQGWIPEANQKAKEINSKK